MHCSRSDRGRGSEEKGSTRASGFAGHGRRVLGAPAAIERSLPTAPRPERAGVGSLSGGTRISTNDRHMSPDSMPYLRVRARSGSSVRPLALEGAVLKAHHLTPSAPQGVPKR
jgi:hypothetical protein